MKQIDIICNDKLYTEMLCLELEAAGYKTERRYTGHADLLLCDAELKREGNCITFSDRYEADLIRPFEISELITLAEQKLKNTEERSDIYSLWVCPESPYAVYRGTQIPLSELEHGILLYLYNRRNEYVSPKELAVAFFEDENMQNPVRVYISYLRNKLDEAFGVKLIYTAREKGYMLKTQ